MVELFAIVYTNKIQGKLCVTRIVGARIGNELSCATSSLGCKTTTHWDSLVSLFIHISGKQCLCDSIESQTKTDDFVHLQMCFWPL